MLSEYIRRILLLGGTGWLGRQIATAARDSGDEVFCLARGQSGNVPEGVVLVQADRLLPGAYDNLTGEWDDVIELAYEPELVGPALDALASGAAHWTLVSSVSVYADNCTPGADETAELIKPKDLTAYPDAKVAAEEVTTKYVGDRLLIARPGLIVGPGDPSDRFGYWPARLHRNGLVLTPTTNRRFVQVIDVDDLAPWIVKAGTDQRVGPVNAVGPAHTMDAFFHETSIATAFEGELHAVHDDALLAHDIRYWAGPRSLPLWLPIKDSSFAQRDGTAFVAAGGHLRPLSETIARALVDEMDRGVDRTRRSGLTAAEERAVLHAMTRH